MQRFLWVGLFLLSFLLVLMLLWWRQPEPQTLRAPTASAPVAEISALDAAAASAQAAAQQRYLLDTPGAQLLGVLQAEGLPLPDGAIELRLVAEALAPSAPCLDAQALLPAPTLYQAQLRSDTSGSFQAQLPGVDTVLADEVCVLLHASHAGYQSQLLTLPLTELEPGLEINLAALLRLQGEVHTPAGRRATGAEVRYWRALDQGQAPGCERINADSLQQLVADDGRFSLALALQEAYCVQALHPDWVASVPVLLALASQADAPGQLRLQLLVGRSLSGRAQDTLGTALAGVRLALQPAAAAVVQPSSTITAEDGSFRFGNVAAGEFTLVSHSPEYAVAKPEQVAMGSQDIRELAVVLQPVTTVGGLILDDRGNPLADVWVSVRSPYLPAETLTRTRTDAQGRYQLPSQHRALAVQQMLVLAQAQDAEALAVPRALATPGRLCLSFYHPEFAHDELALDSQAAQLALEPVYMMPVSQGISGQVRNPDGDGMAANLRFIFLDGAATAPMHCDDSVPDTELTTDAQGYYTGHLPRAGRYEVVVLSELYRPRHFEHSLQGAESGLDFQVE